MAYDEVKLAEVASYISRGITPSYTEAEGVCVINQKCIRNGVLSLAEARLHNESKKKVPIDKIIKPMDILVNSTGTGTLGRVAQVTSNIRATVDSHVTIVRPAEKVDPLFLGYAVKWRKPYIEALAEGSTGQTELSRFRLGDEITIPLPSLAAQKQIAETLFVIDCKINTNSMINDNLQQQVMALFHKMFIETSNDDRRECRADEYFDISIGKTPPRKEPQWFSTDPTDRVWVSISDMGSCGLYIADSSEYLTHESVEKFNVKVVPDNTVLLSFKLTVGRVAITDGAMTTNEAIAHFKIDKSEITEYLYCYLKGFNYQTMGSTSSIATAVNSKIIKAMPFIVPADDELAEFHAFAEPVFAMIKANQRENARLAELRDSLLPRLMSGEIDVSNIDI